MQILSFVSVLAVVGYSNFLTQKFMIKNSYAFLLVVSCISIIQTIFAILGLIKLSSLFLLSVGCLLLVLSYYPIVKNRADKQQHKVLLKNNAIFLLLCGVLAIYCIDLPVGGAIDVYSYWAVISKSIYLHGSLPDNLSFIAHSHLSYTPGLAVFHYLFYCASGEYSIWAMHFAQAVILLSALMVLVEDKHSTIQSMFFMSVMVLLLSFGFGTIFTRVTSDGYLAAYTLSLLYILYRESSAKALALLLCMPLAYLYLIKQVGLFSAITVAACYLIVFFKGNKVSKKQLFIYTLLLLAPVILTKVLWLYHYHSMNFSVFNQGITTNNAIAALNPFNTSYHYVQQHYLSSIFLTRADRILGIPYIVIYLCLFFMWFKIHKNMEVKIYPMAATLIAFLFVYLVMIYLLQALTFHVGFGSSKEILSFARYYNILFVPFVGLILYAYLSSKAQIHKLVMLTVCIITVLIMTIGNISMRHRANRNYAAQQQLAQQIQPYIAQSKESIVCVSNFSGPSYETWMPLQFYLLTHKIQYISNGLSVNNLQRALINKKCDYLALYSRNKNSPVPAQFTSLLQIPYKTGYVNFLKL